MTQYWTVPIESKEAFQRIMNQHLVIWPHQDKQLQRVAGGIDENTIPMYPIVEGYSVEYDDDGNIINSTGFKRPPWGEFQIRGFNAIVSRNHLLLADDAGLGNGLHF